MKKKDQSDTNRRKTNVYIKILSQTLYYEGVSATQTDGASEASRSASTHKHYLNLHNNLCYDTKNIKLSNQHKHSQQTIMCVTIVH